MSAVSYMHGRTATYDELRKPVTEKSAGQLIDDVIDLWIKGKGPAPEMVSDPDYSGPQMMGGKTGAYAYSYRETVPNGKGGWDYSGTLNVDVPATEEADAFAGITRADYDAYVSRVKVSRTGVVTTVKARKAAARKTVAKCATCPHCGGTL